MGTACGRAGVLGSALIHTKTGAHREDVAQHAGDRFGSPITRRPDAAALSDGADSPLVSIPVHRMPPRKPQMTRRARGGPGRLSQSVTSTGQIFLCVLQVETNGRHGSQTSQSVTVTKQNQPQMLQIETVELSAEEQSQSVTTRPRIPRQMLQIETNVPNTRPDRPKKDRTSSHHNWNVRPRQTSTREAEPTDRSLYSASGSLKFLGSKTMQV